MTDPEPLPLEIEAKLYHVVSLFEAAASRKWDKALAPRVRKPESGKRVRPTRAKLGKPLYAYQVAMDYIRENPYAQTRRVAIDCNVSEDTVFKARKVLSAEKESKS